VLLLGAPVSVPLSASALVVPVPEGFSSAPGDAAAPGEADPGEAGPQAPEPAPDAAEAGTPPDPAPVPDQAMGAYSAADYAEEAAALPADLARAVTDDLGLTPAEYLARADAAYAASSVLDALAAGGVTVLDSRMNGTELVVNVADETDAAAVEAANATPEIGGADSAPAPSIDTAPGSAAFLADELVGGQGYYSYLPNDYISLCSVGFNGADVSSRQKQMLTAGHCYDSQQFDGGRAYELVQSAPNTIDAGGPRIAQPIVSTYRSDGGVDSGLAVTNTSDWTPVPRVGTWGSTENDSPVTSGDQLELRDFARAIVEQPICRSGRTSGWRCGTVLEVDYDLEIGAAAPYSHVNSVISTVCALSGDSGGSVVSGPYAIGVLSAGSYEKSCNENDRFSAAFPMVAANGKKSVRVANPDWELAVSVSTPVVSKPEAGEVVTPGSVMSGTVPNATARYSVRVSIDGGTALSAPVESSGKWSLALPTLSSGEHEYSVRAVYASGLSASDKATGTFTSDSPDVARIAGPDRYAGAVAIADAAFPGGTADVVYVATGANYPDALSAGPAAVKQGGPLLLVEQNAVPGTVAAKLKSLAPKTIVIVGGPNSVSAAVKKTLGSLVPGATVERIAGADRYSGSRILVDSVFDTAPHTYVATGTNFPDALSAGGAAGSKGEPVVLVNGPTASADAPTLDFFRKLSTDSITIVGGVNSVSTGVAESLATGVPAAVDRVAGDNRYLASLELNRSAFASASTIYLATGQNFPDALAGGVLAGMNDAPLYVVPGDCVPRGVLQEIDRLGADDVVLLGGPNSLGAGVLALSPCGE
jgi:putative cell wall-binding protein